MSENIGKLTTPSGDGARIEVTENNVNVVGQLINTSGELIVKSVESDSTGNNVSIRTLSNTEELRICAGSDLYTSGRIYLYPNDFPVENRRGCVTLTTSGIVDPNDGSTEKLHQLQMFSDGRMTLDNYSIEPIIHSVITNNNYQWYVRNGIFIQAAYTNASSGTVITFPKTFNTAPVVMAIHKGTGDVNCLVDSISTTNFTLNFHYLDPTQVVEIYWLAIGG